MKKLIALTIVTTLYSFNVSANNDTKMGTPTSTLPSEEFIYQEETYKENINTDGTKTIKTETNTTTSPQNDESISIPQDLNNNINDTEEYNNFEDFRKE